MAMKTVFNYCDAGQFMAVFLETNFNSTIK